MSPPIKIIFIQCLYLVYINVHLIDILLREQAVLQQRSPYSLCVAIRLVRQRTAMTTLNVAGLCLHRIRCFLYLPDTQGQKQGFCQGSTLWGLPAECSWQMVGRHHVSLHSVLDLLTIATM